MWRIMRRRWGRIRARRRSAPCLLPMANGCSLGCKAEALGRSLVDPIAAENRAGEAAACAPRAGPIIRSARWRCWCWHWSPVWRCSAGVCRTGRGAVAGFRQPDRRRVPLQRPLHHPLRPGLRRHLAEAVEFPRLQAAARAALRLRALLLLRPGRGHARPGRRPALRSTRRCPASCPRTASPPTAPATGSAPSSTRRLIPYFIDINAILNLDLYLAHGPRLRP